MINSESEYKEAVARVAEARRRMAVRRARLQNAGMAGDEIKRVLEPAESFHLQLEEEVAEYERVKTGSMKARHVRLADVTNCAMENPPNGPATAICR